MTAVASAKRRQTERIMFRVEKGALRPADRWAVEKLRARHYHLGDVVSCEVRKLRNPKFYRLAHQLAQLLIGNLPEFSKYTDAHRVLKRLQWEADIACDVMPVMMDGLVAAEVRIPLSMSFDAMDEGEFTEVFTGFCRHIVDRYWPSMTVEQIQEMAEMMEGSQ